MHYAFVDESGTADPFSGSQFLVLELWSDAERTQLTRNTQALRARLDQIPGEIEAEQAAIHARFADLQPRMFPVAVTFLVPERFDR